MEKKDVRILLVDDFELVRVSIKKTLGQLGFFKIDEATNGVEALAKMNLSLEAQDPYMLVFCDWLMPEMNGLQVIEACQASVTLKQIPVVMVTAEAEQQSVLKAVKAGAVDYIVKPIETAKLKSKVERILAKFQGPQAA